MTILQILHTQGGRWLLVAFCSLSLSPHPSAQTGNELMADACYNELHQRKQHALWESQVPKFGVNFTVILQIWPKIEHSSTSCLQQLMNFGKRSLIPPAVLAYERDGGFSLPSLGSRVS